MAPSNVPFPDFDDEGVVSHGFSFRPAWWHKAVARPAWTAHLDRLPLASGDGYRRIARADLFAAASDEPAPAVAVSAYAWGTGTGAFLVGRRARAFRRNDAEVVADRLTRARDLLSNAGAAEAYQSLLRGGRNNVRYLGPSFFTKLLYAYDAREGQPGRALILDRFVAAGLNRRHGWSFSTRGPWSTHEYGRWLDLAHDEAHRASQELGRRVRADAVEKAYFCYGRALATGRC
ncbi:hypothetical protein COUCH_17575 [Couchioplanes caeruleus]|uniref:8-oxoguanine DNA glycosylase OGG fold protein n=1 Tax=Couchioplanes caeruleus TaxID=56438 RepID=UPI0020BDD111|nr:hypothetical protein [Couchioplanes caeruleus]UQU67976.1 hypothetical protein COUCH_17575 [Couchioplanes caeruleus]